ncbi:hypothetical protein [Niameybacter massiliensis]|uniref:hypothetical protein n=1 Tax=Niameybacter massiliensis TaxID=1658108 RepID=UPI0006B668EA|nr:hypothetical protein [Niameybacter massiliensis]
MADVCIKLISSNTTVDKGVKPSNLILLVQLDSIWNTILEEANRYTGEVYIYIQVQFSIPIIDSQGQAAIINSGISQEMLVSSIPTDKIVTLYAAYNGTYNNQSTVKECAQATIWIYQHVQGNG